jgi:hypothetical protein
VSHLHNHRLQGTSLTAIFCSLLRPFSTSSQGFAAKFWTSCLSHQANVPSSKSCAALAFSFDSLWTIEIRGTLNLLGHGHLRSSHHPFKLTCITTVSNVNGLVNPCTGVSKSVYNSVVHSLNVSNGAVHLKIYTRLSMTRSFAMDGEQCLLCIHVIIGIGFPQFHLCTIIWHNRL